MNYRVSLARANTRHGSRALTVSDVSDLEIGLHGATYNKRAHAVFECHCGVYKNENY